MSQPPNQSDSKPTSPPHTSRPMTSVTFHVEDAQDEWEMEDGATQAVSQPASHASNNSASHPINPTATHPNKPNTTPLPGMAG